MAMGSCVFFYAVLTDEHSVEISRGEDMGIVNKMGDVSNFEYVVVVWRIGGCFFFMRFVVWSADFSFPYFGGFLGIENTGG